VARPFVLGEDPGLLDQLSDPGGLILTLLVLVTGVGWAAWRLWSGQRPWYGGVVGIALLVVVGLVFLSAEAAAHYKHPARLIAWEWLGLLLTFFLVRQLAVSSRERQGLLAAFLAGAVALSAHAVYQDLVELPALREQTKDDRSLREAMRKRHVEMNPAELQVLRERMQYNYVFGTFAHPNSFAGYLALALPALVGAVVVSRRDPSAGWRPSLAGVCALLGLIGLWLTHSRGAIGATVLVGLVVAALLGRRLLLRQKRVTILGLVLALAVGISLLSRVDLSSAFGKQSSTAAVRLEYWRATWKMIQERPWLGVGPGNFGATYPRFMDETAEEKIKDPHNFLFEMWSTSGIFALLALLVALGAFFFQVGRGLVRWSRAPSLPEESKKPGEGETMTSDGLIPWDFYLGGTIGLLLSFVLRVQDLAPDDILAEAVAAALRSVVWFAAFALFERIAWTDRVQVVVLSAGVAALLVNLGVSGGISFPSVTGPMWVAIALALNALPLEPSPWLTPQRWSLSLPLPILSALTLIYVAYVFYPIMSSTTEVKNALLADLHLRADLAKRPQERTIPRPLSDLNTSVIGRYEKAFREDPNNARIAVHLARAYGQLWTLDRMASLDAARKAILAAQQAEQLDPDGREGYEAEYQLRMSFGQGRALNKGEQAAKESRQEFQLAAEALERMVPKDPTDAPLRYLVAEALDKAGDKEAAAQQAAEALRLDEIATRPTRKLRDEAQRELARKWRSAGSIAR
jgi:putative inorganic carbon (HCO3(-)) transporter